MEPLIFIFNPLKSKIEDEFIRILKDNTNANYISLNSLNNLYHPADIHPDLIFLVLDDCCDHFKTFDISDINFCFPCIPVIGIIKSDSICYECSNIQKIIWNFITYPFKKEDVLLAVKWYSSNGNYKLNKISSSLKKHALFDLFIGESKATLEIKEKILKIANYDVTVLIQGETGTGKELCAKMIHFLSGRSKNNFVPLNCGAVPAELFENELFGHKKGAYTNADTNEKGLIAEADKGTLFLDEIESLPESMQVKLLRFLEERKYKPLGQSEYNNSDTRIIAASKESLRKLVEKNKFREDLFYRLNVLNLYIPPLKEREDDIPLLASHFIEKYSKLYDKKIQGILPQALMKMLHHSWSGNIRELENVILEAIIFNTAGWIEPGDLNFELPGDTSEYSSGSLKQEKESVINNFEIRYLKNMMSIFNGNISKAAIFAKKDRRAFYRLLKKYHIDAESYR